VDRHNSERVLKGASYVPLRNSRVYTTAARYYRQAGGRASELARSKEVRKSRHSTHKNTNARQRDRRPRPAKITLQEILLTDDIERGKFAEETTAVPATNGEREKEKEKGRKKRKRKRKEVDSGATRSFSGTEEGSKEVNLS